MTETRESLRLPGARLDATITFDGRPVRARAGEPVAVALLAEGVRTLRTTPRAGEPRGIFCMVGRCSDCLMIIDGIPGVRACTALVYDGMDVRTQHGHGDWDGPNGGGE